MANALSPLAPTSTTHLLDTLQAAKLIDDWQTTFNIDISSELNGIEEISLYRCQASQLDFFIPASAAGSEQLYRDLRKFDWFYMPEKWEFEEAFKDLVGCKRILEVGCGPGFFVEKATKKLKGSMVKGIELSEAAIQKALQKNLPVERVDLQELMARGEIFDAVCSFQVLEHVGQPREFLEVMVKVLRPGGKLILCVPNKDGFLRHTHNNLLDMPPHHMSRWNVFTFKYLEKLFPLRMVRRSFEPLAKYHIFWYVHTYGQLWRTRLPVLQRFLSEPKLRRIADILEKSGLYPFLRGHSLYVSFKKL
jgi:SAM-dependent methyltransferase